MSDFLIGRVLGDFVVEQYVGLGASSFVYLARQPLLQRSVIIKMGRSRGAQHAELFLTEARLASRVEHPYIAHIYGYGVEADGLFWIAMEHVQGTPLTQFNELGGFRHIDPRPFLRRLCDVVHTVHQAGVVHRDIKPDNVMVIARHGSHYPKLLDLGIALQVGEAGTQAVRVGTPAYIAPELWVSAGAATPASDIYALGALIYETYSGVKPFAATRLLDIAARHARLVPPPLNEDVPIEVRHAVSKALAKRPEERHATALELADSLLNTAGADIDAVGLPQLDAVTRDAVETELPTPIAMAVRRVGATARPERILAATLDLQRTIAQVVGTLALACAQRIGGGRHSEIAAVHTFLQNVRTGEPSTAAWWQVARDVVRPFAGAADVFPAPEIVALFFDHAVGVRTAMDEWLASADKVPAAAASSTDILNFLVGVFPIIERALRSLMTLHHYALVSPSAEHGAWRTWVGASVGGHVHPMSHPLHGVGLAVRPPDVGMSPRLIADLSDFVSEEAPTDGDAPTLFWATGAGLNGRLRYRSLPEGFEIQEAPAWLQPETHATASTLAMPYMGLRTFDEADASKYFGRERETTVFLNRLRKSPWIVVVGPSGAGKSSFIRAGVLPQVGRALRIVLRPGEKPLATLTAALRSAGLPLSDPLTPTTSPHALRLAVRRAQPTDPVIIVVDQFEELFTQAPAEERETFTALLAQEMQDSHDTTRVIFTIRDDFLARATTLSVFRNALSSHLHLLATPGVADLRRILTEPARRAGFAFEDESLATEMVTEVAKEPSALALLSFTAARLWELRDRSLQRLTRAGYRAIGGVSGALAQHAESVAEAMSPPERLMLREAFRHLVTADGTRAALSRGELLEVMRSPHAVAVVDRLVDARLLVTTGENDAEKIEVVHETLLSAWPRAVRWRAEDAEHARLRDQLRAAARQWRDGGATKDLLWRGDTLVEFRLWRKKHNGHLTELEERFTQQSEQADQRRRRIRDAIIAMTGLVLVVTVIVFARLRQEAVGSRQLALASEERTRATLVGSYWEAGRLALISGNHIDALAHLAAAFRDGRTDQPTRLMIGRALEAFAATTATMRTTAPCTSVATWPGGTMLGSSDGRATWWDVAGRLVTEVPLSVSGRVIVAAHPSGQIFAAGDDSGLITVWGEDRKTSKQLAGHARTVGQLTFLDEGHLLSAAADGTSRIWDLARGDSVKIGTPRSFAHTNALAISPTHLAVGTYQLPGESGDAALWKLGQAGGAHSTVLSPTSGVRGFALSRKAFATAGTDMKARTWSFEGRLLQEFVGHSGSVYAVAFSPDGQLLASVSSDATLRTWNTATGEPLSTWSDPLGPLTMLAYASPTTLFAAGNGGDAIIWNPEDSAVEASLVVGGVVNQISLAPDGARLVASSVAGFAKQFNAHAASRPARMPAPGGRGAWSDVTHDGRRAVRESQHGVEVLDVASAQATVLADTVGMYAVLDHDTGDIAVFDDKTIYIAAQGEAVRPERRAVEGGVVMAHQHNAYLAVATLTNRVELRTPTGHLVASHQLSEELKSILLLDAFLVATTATSVTVLTVPGLDVVFAQPLPFYSLFPATGDRWITKPSYSDVTLWEGTRELMRLKMRGAISDMRWRGDELFVGLHNGGVQIWNTKTGELATDLTAHSQSVTFISGGVEQIVTVDKTGEALLWQRATNVPLLRWRLPADTQAVHLSPDGLLVASPSGWRRWPLAQYEGSASGLDAIVACAIDPALRSRLPIPEGLQCLN